MYATFEHTADIGLRIRAPDLKGLFEDAGRALFSVMAANLDGVRPVQAVTLEVQGTERDALLRDWLGELLYTFHTRHVILARFDVQLHDSGLTATAWGEPIDLQRHELDVEVKAVTWHGLMLRQDSDGWLAELILDI